MTLRQLLDHLVTTYAAIDQFDLEKNQEKMTARYDPNAPIETLFDHRLRRIEVRTFHVQNNRRYYPPLFGKNGGVSQRLEGVESEATSHPRLEHLHSALCKSASRVEGKPAPQRRKKFALG